MTMTLPTRPAVRGPALDRTTAMRLAAEEYRRVVDQLRGLAPEDWARPTACSEWDVRAMAGHMLGMVKMSASQRQLISQNLAARRAGGGIDALTAVQVRREAPLSPGQLVEQLTALAPRAVRGRRRAPSLLRRRTVPEEQLVGGVPEKWSFGFLLDVIATRDPWMHRTDIARATGREPELTADHDGVLVADVVAEWAQRHGQPFRLTLTGPAGGSWSSGTDGEEHELDAVEFCRVLSGRETGTGLLAQQVPF